MTFNLPIWQRACVFGALCVLAVIYVSLSASDETRLGKAPLRTATNPVEAAYLHAITSGFNLLGFKPDSVGVIHVQSRAIYHARAGFLLMSYSFLRKVFTDPACDRIQGVKIYPHAYMIREDGRQVLGPFAELVLMKKDTEGIDWTAIYPDLDEFQRALIARDAVRYDLGSVP